MPTFAAAQDCNHDQSHRSFKRRRSEDLLGVMKQRVVDFVMDVWLATAGLWDCQILEARFSTFAAGHTPLPSVSADPQGFCTS